MISIRRFKEWVEIITGPRIRLRDLRKIVGGALKLIFGSVERREWRRRMRKCYLCPVFDVKRKTCRPFPESEMGCGCYTPYSNLVKDGECWGRKRYGKNFGW